MLLLFFFLFLVRSRFYLQALMPQFMLKFVRPYYTGYQRISHIEIII